MEYLTDVLFATNAVFAVAFAWSVLIYNKPKTAQLKKVPEISPTVVQLIDSLLNDEGWKHIDRKNKDRYSYIAEHWTNITLGFGFIINDTPPRIFSPFVQHLNNDETTAIDRALKDLNLKTILSARSKALDEQIKEDNKTKLDGAK